MLTTPLGDIDIFIDGEQITYEAVKLDGDPYRSLAGRYYIGVSFCPDGKVHEIICCIKNHIEDERDDIECGERLELKSFYKGDYKLSIGMEGDTGYFEDGTRLNDDYDYDNGYTENGVKYELLPETRTEFYVFGVAWIEGVTEENDVETWLGADPTLMKID